MISVLSLEPKILSRFCDDAPCHEAAEEYLKTLIDLEFVARRKIFSAVLIHESIFGTLCQLGLFPALEHFRTYIRNSELGDFYSPNDINTMFCRLIDRCVTGKDILGFEEILFDQLRLDSLSSSELLDANMRDVEELFFVYSAISVECLPEVYFVPVVWDDVSPKHVAARIHYLEAVGPPADMIQVPCDVDVELDVSFFDGNFTRGLDPQTLWNRATAEQDLYLSLVDYCYNFLSETAQNVRWTDVTDFFIGADFMDSLARVGGVGGPFSSVIFEACGRLVAGHPKCEVSPFRISKKSTEQRTRLWDGARAYRTHVTMHNEGLRLMYWELTDGRIELANVGPKHEEIILEGSKADRFGGARS